VDIGHGAPFYLLVGSIVVLLPLLFVSFRFLPWARIDLSRSVLVHAGCERVWKFVDSVPTLHAGHGKVGEFGGIARWSLRHGDGAGAGSIWRATGTWGDSPYWADVEILRVVPGREIAIRLRRDSLGTQRGLRDHAGALSLESIGPEATKITWRLEARLRGPRLLAARLVSSRRLRARLLDQGLRSLKVEIESSADSAEQPPAAGRGEVDGPGVAPPPDGWFPPETTA
jgi:uncharacterized protein YndB with AHSA1/START domain